MVYTYAAAPKLSIHVLGFIMCVGVCLHAHIHRQSWIQFTHERNKHKFSYKICWAINSISTVTISLSCHLFLRDSGFLTLHPAFILHPPKGQSSYISFLPMSFSSLGKTLKSWRLATISLIDLTPVASLQTLIQYQSTSLCSRSSVCRLLVKPGLIPLSNFCSPFLNTVFTLGVVCLLPLFNKIGPFACQSFG